MWSKAVINILILTVILVGGNCYPQGDLYLEEDELTSIGLNILTIMLSRDNYGEDNVHHMGRNPDTYDLYYKGALSDLFYSDKYWIDINHYYDTSQNPMADGPTYKFEYIFILPRSDGSYFYLITNFFDPSDQAEPIEIFELRRYDTEDLIIIYERLKQNSDFSRIECEIIAKYNYTSVIGSSGIITVVNAGM